MAITYHESIHFSHLLLIWFIGFGIATGYEKYSGAGAGNREWFAQGKIGQERASLIFLRGANEEGEAAGRCDQVGSNGKNVFEAFDGAECHHVERVWLQGFGADIFYIDVCQCKSAADFAEERGFLVVRFDERERDLWSPEFHGKARKAGARA
jgi:hypothetical protein